MDIDLLKTFVEVYRTRHFGRAADNLYITHSAASARIRQLEELLGARLLTRARNNIQLTPAGERLLRHAEAILAQWQAALQSVPLSEEEGLTLAVGGMADLWDMLVQPWLQGLHATHPELRLRAEAHGADILIRRLLEGVLDVAFLFEAPQIPDLHVVQLPDVRLVLLTTRPGVSAGEALGEGYVRVDWGTSFNVLHGRHFPDAPEPRLRMAQGRLALDFILARGGAAYLPQPTAQSHLDAGRLHAVADAPVIERQAFAAYAYRGARRRLVDEALQQFLRR
ncbi:LysR family transcriptional regulator [Ectothiorhodospiraceae bacterium 2226]|nr:LysR family transcriptional regulator [Ectothiorhodospiraceae bacterium 2226]